MSILSIMSMPVEKGFIESFTQWLVLFMILIVCIGIPFYIVYLFYKKLK